MRSRSPSPPRSSHHSRRPLQQEAHRRHRPESQRQRVRYSSRSRSRSPSRRYDEDRRRHRSPDHRRSRPNLNRTDDARHDKRPARIEREFYTEPQPDPNAKEQLEEVPAEDGGQHEDRTEEEKALFASLGFGSFGTTKGQKVKAQTEGLVEVIKRQTYRQYMNRKGGFNRPLDKVD